MFVIFILMFILLPLIHIPLSINYCYFQFGTGLALTCLGGSTQPLGHCGVTFPFRNSPPRVVCGVTFRGGNSVLCTPRPLFTNFSTSGPNPKNYGSRSTNALTLCHRSASHADITLRVRCTRKQQHHLTMIMFFILFSMFVYCH